MQINVAYNREDKQPPAHQDNGRGSWREGSVCHSQTLEGQKRSATLATGLLCKPLRQDPGPGRLSHLQAGLRTTTTV